MLMGLISWLNILLLFLKVISCGNWHDIEKIVQVYV